MTKIQLTPFVLTFFATFLGALFFQVILEFHIIRVEKITNLVILIFTLLSFISLYFVSNYLKKEVRAFFHFFFFVVVGVMLFHFFTNSFNIYKNVTLPSIFYQLRIYRIISLSANFLIQLVFLSLGVHLILLAPRKYFKIRLDRWYTYLIPMYLLVIFLLQSQQALAIAYRDSLQVAVNTNTTFDDRIAYKLGGSSYYGWIWPYTRFIIKHTEANSIIAIPPQSVVWKMEGNADYLRWFIYPRKTVKQLEDGSIPSEAEYALISIGECGEGDCGWPKRPIPKEKIEYIALIDRATQNEQILTNIDYSLDTSKFIWGIIKFKK